MRYTEGYSLFDDCITSHYLVSSSVQKNHIYTSGASGTNAAVIRGALRAEKPELLTVILPQSLKKQPPESQELLSKVSLIAYKNLYFTYLCERYQLNSVCSCSSSLWALFGFPSRSFKTRLLGKGFHTLIKGVSFSSPTNVGFSQSTPLRGPASLLAHRLVSTPFGEQPPRWLIVRCLTLILFVMAQVHPQQTLSFLDFSFRDFPQGFF